MSHFRMAVIRTETSPSVETLLDPYSENKRVSPYVDITKDEMLIRLTDEIARIRDAIDDGHVSRYNEELMAHANDDSETLLAWYAERGGYERDEDGNFLTTYNPNSKYDYFSEIETIPLAEWETCTTDATEEELRNEWREFSTKGDGFYNSRYYLERYGDEDTYVKVCLLPVGWGVVTPDGEWHEPGQVGWFGTDDSTAESIRDWVNLFHERFIEPYNRDGVTVTILDCHI
jgi:hypothetical protein